MPNGEITDHENITIYNQKVDALKDHVNTITVYHNKICFSVCFIYL